MTRATPDPWEVLRNHTAARIALGRAGQSLPTAELLKFSYDHADARDAVHSELDLDRLEKDLAGLNLPIVRVATQVSDRLSYLQRPDLGCELDPASRETLQSSGATPRDIVLIVADGLSALAAQNHAVAVLTHLVALLREARYSIGPLVIARFARVALQDEIGDLIHARSALILLGERPGLGTADSLGAYFVFDPKRGKTNADRNCVSNIRPAGLAPAAASQTLNYLIAQSLRQQISGIALKDERGASVDRSLFS